MPAFHLHLDILALGAALLTGYEYGVRRFADGFCPKDEVPVRPAQRLAFWAGVLLMVLVSTWPMHDIAGEHLFMFHMAEHLALSLVVPPLLLAGTPWWLMRAVVRPILPVLKVLTKPLIALVLFNGWLAVLHAPGVVNAMLTNEAFHFVAHALLFVSALLMWWPVLDPIPDTRTLTPFGKMGYLFLQSLVPTIPASFMTLGSEPLYPIYESFERLWGIRVMTDQIIAGLMMKIGGGLILWGFIAWVFFSWHANEQQYESSPIVVTRQS